MKPVQLGAVWRSSMLTYNKYVNVDDIIQGRVFPLTDVIARWLTERLMYRQRENKEIIFSS